jgi:hypothetical protein
MEILLLQDIFLLDVVVCDDKKRPLLLECIGLLACSFVFYTGDCSAAKGESFYLNTIMINLDSIIHRNITCNLNLFYFHLFIHDYMFKYSTFMIINNLCSYLQHVPFNFNRFSFSDHCKLIKTSNQ